MALWSVELDEALTQEQAAKRFRTERTVMVAGIGLLIVVYGIAAWLGMGVETLVFLVVMMAVHLFMSNLKMLHAKVAYLDAKMRAGRK